MARSRPLECQWSVGLDRASAHSKARSTKPRCSSLLSAHIPCCNRGSLSDGQKWRRAFIHSRSPAHGSVHSARPTHRLSTSTAERSRVSPNHHAPCEGRSSEHGAGFRDWGASFLRVLARHRDLGLVLNLRFEAVEEGSSYGSFQNRFGCVARRVSLYLLCPRKRGLPRRDTWPV
jgi:hypothetical protein